MFCSKCGVKIEKGNKFCPKCGHSISGEAKEPAEAAKHGKGCAWVCLIVIVIVLFSALSSYSGRIKNTPELKYGLYCLAALIILFIGWGLFKAIKNLIKAFRTRPWKTGLTAGLIIAVIVIPALLISSYSRRRLADNFGAFQNSLADVLNAKYLGDDIMADKSSASFSSVKAITQAAVDNMAKVKGDDKYYQAIYDWASQINTVAASKKTWKNLPDPPSGIGEVLSSQAAKYQYQISLDRTVLLKDYGDWAIAKDDKDAMRQIAAELKAEETWQNNLADQFAIDFINQAYAATNSVKTPRASLPRGGCKGVMPCRRKTGPLISHLAQAARNFSVGSPGAAEEWKKDWDDFTKIVKINNGYNLEGLGVIQNGQAKQDISPMEQAFNSECQAKDGTTGGTGGVKDRLPITLSAGALNCDYKDGPRACWDTLTRVGQRLMGGENGCAELNLLPKPAPVAAPKNSAPTATSKPKAKTTTPTAKPATAPNWDGNYNITMTKPNCDSPIELTVFQITGGAVNNLYGNNAPIDANGKATMVSGEMTMHFAFTENGVSGTWSAGQCNGTFQGSKNG